MSRGRGARRRRVARRASAKTQQLSSNTGLVEVLERRKAAREARDELAVSGATGLPLSDRNAAWDAGAAAKSLDPADFAKAFFWKDPDGDPKTKAAYKLGFASKQGGTLTAIWRGVTAAAGAVQGARGGVQIPSGDVAAVKGRIGTYYAAAAKKFKDDGIKTPWAASNEATVAFAQERDLELVVGDDGIESLSLAETDPVLDELVAVQTLAAAQALAAAELGADAEPELLGMATALWLDEFAPEVEPTVGEFSFLAPVRVGEDGERVVSEPSEWIAWEQVETSPIAVNPGLGRLVLTEFAVSAPDAPVAATLPDEHKPGARMPRRNPTAKEPTAPEVATVGPMTWSAILAPEGRLTSDRRAFAPGSITWPRLDDGPLTLMGMVETSEGGHVGAEVSGRIDRIWRDDASGLIRASGVFDEGEFGQEVARMVADQTLRGVSVDLAISRYETGPMGDWFDEDGNWAPSEDSQAPSLVDLFSDDVIAVVLEAEIGAATVCPFPAFAEARIAEGDSLVAGANPAFWTVTQQAGWTVEECEACGEALTASVLASELVEAGAVIEVSLTAAAAGLVPETPPADWFADPGFEEPTAICVDDDGRISGHAATWGVCHIGFPSSCRTAPRSKTDYSYFHLGEIVCDDGSRLPCGQITLDAPHADLRLDRAGATRHYDHTGTVVAHVRCGEDEHGIWVAGALQPDAPAEKVRLLRGSKLSGDWRDGELVALLAVNVPGFPVPRARAMAAAGEDGTHVLAMVAAGIPVFEAELSEEERERFAELAELAEAG